MFEKKNYMKEEILAFFKQKYIWENIFFICYF